MPTLANAPLIEVILEIRWGAVKKDNLERTKEFLFSQEEIDFFPGQFKMIVKSNGFPYFERANPHVEAPIPHVPVFRFRKAESTWPCYQIGLGIFTVNQTNDGYNWDNFKLDAINGIDFINKSHPLGIEKLNIIGIELKYRDGFLFKEDEKPLEFLNNKFNLGFNPPVELLKYKNVQEPISAARLSFRLNTKTPKGLLIFDLRQGKINGKPAFITDTVTRCMGEDIPELNKESFLQWIENAHLIQQHTFKTIINPIYARTFE